MRCMDWTRSITLSIQYWVCVGCRCISSHTRCFSGCACRSGGLVTYGWMGAVAAEAGARREASASFPAGISTGLTVPIVRMPRGSSVGALHAKVADFARAPSAICCGMVCGRGKGVRDPALGVLGVACGPAGASVRLSGNSAAMLPRGGRTMVRSMVAALSVIIGAVRGDLAIALPDGGRDD